MNPITLSLFETRVLGVLIEKQHTVPDTYPMTLNTLTAGCNQKTSRDPITNMSEPEIQATLDALKAHSMIVETSGGRVMRYAHNTERVLRLPTQSVALLAVLMLRGPQTVGELRINCDRLHKFADTSAVDAFLQELASREAGALVKELPKRPGERENRWVHLLSGEPVLDAVATVSSDTFHHSNSSEIAALQVEISQLREELAALKADINMLRASLKA